MRFLKWIWIWITGRSNVHTISINAIDGKALKNWFDNGGDKKLISRLKNNQL